jgi:hypothetical protein
MVRFPPFVGELESEIRNAFSSVANNWDLISAAGAVDTLVGFCASHNLVTKRLALKILSELVQDGTGANTSDFSSMFLF